jgi:hypothetical protein
MLYNFVNWIIPCKNFVVDLWNKYYSLYSANLFLTSALVSALNYQNIQKVILFFNMKEVKIYFLIFVYWLVLRPKTGAKSLGSFVNSVLISRIIISSLQNDPNMKNIKKCQVKFG